MYKFSKHSYVKEEEVPWLRCSTNCILLSGSPTALRTMIPAAADSLSLQGSPPRPSGAGLQSQHLTGIFFFGRGGGWRTSGALLVPTYLDSLPGYLSHTCPEHSRGLTAVESHPAFRGVPAGKRKCCQTPGGRKAKTRS